MADTNKEKSEEKKPIYKYGEAELDLDTYIHNLGINLNTYLDKVKKDWTEDLKNEFVTAFDRYLNGFKEQLSTGVERFSTNNYGKITDLLGILSNVDNDDIDPVGSEYYYNKKGERITTDDYNKLSKRKLRDYKTFSANKEVALYFKIIGEKLKNAKSKESATDTTNYFDLGSHGFIQFHANKYNPTGGAWDGTSILELDPYDETTKKRDIAKRMESLKSAGYEYLDSLDPNIDFSKTRWKSRDGYINFAKNVFDRVQDGISPEDYLDFGQLGITRNFLEPYVTIDKEILTSQQEDEAEAKAKSEEEAKKKKELEEAYRAMMQEKFDIYNNNKGLWDEENPYALGSLSYWNPTTGFDQAAFEASFNKEKNPSYYDNAGKFIGYDNYLNGYLTGNNIFSTEGKRALSALIGMNQYRTIDSGKYQGMFYIPSLSDRTTNSGLVYDPVTGGLQRVFIGDIPSEMERIKRKWLEDQGIVNRMDNYKLFKEGGSIELMQLGGGFSADAWMQENREKALKERAQKEGRTTEQQKAGERKTSEDAIDPANPDAGWKGTDSARVASSIADIFSMISAFVPGAGTAISGVFGIGSSLTSFGADWAEDGLDWGDVKNLGANLGLDILGLIPGGGAASKGVKIAKTLGKYASRAMAAVAGAQGLANSDNIIASINKMTTDPTNLTVDDWRNVAQGFGLLTGGIAAGARKYHKSEMEANMKAKAQGAVAVEMVDKKNPSNKKIVAFNGDDAKAIREALKSGDLQKLREVTVGKYEQFRDWDLSTTGNFGFRSVKGDSGWQMPFGAKEGKAKVFDMYGDAHGNLYTKGGNWQSDVKTGKPIDSATELQTATVDKAVAAHKQSILDKLTGISERKKRQVAYQEAEIKKTDDAFATEIKQKQDAKVAADATNDPAQITAAQNALDDALMRQTDWATKRNRILQTINDIKTGKVKAYEKWKKDYLKGTGKDAMLVITNNPYKRPDYEVAFELILKDLNLKPEYFKYERGGRFNNVRRFLGGGGFETVTDVYNPGDWFKDMYASNEMFKWFDTIDIKNPDSWKQFNDLLDSWYANKTRTKYDGTRAVKDNTNGVYNRQVQWHDITRTNGIFERIKDLKRNNGSTDNPEGDYRDGIFGSQENFRHTGTIESWKAHQDELTKAIEYWKTKGFTYAPDKNGMYKLTPIESQPTTSPATPPVTTTNDETAGKTAGETDPAGNTLEDGTQTTTNPSSTGFLSKLFSNPTLTYGLPRALYADRMNRGITDLNKEAEIPIYKDWVGHTDFLVSDLGEEMRGIMSEAELLNMANNFQTTDIEKKMAMMKEAKKQGLLMKNEGMRASDKALREKAEIISQHNYQDDVVAVEAANTNRAAGISTIGNNAKHEAAYLSKKHNIWDTLGKQLEYEAKIGIEENKAAQDTLIRADITNKVMSEAITNGESLGLNTNQIEALKLLQSGKSFSLLTTELQESVLTAKQILKELETAEWAKYKGLKRWGDVRLLVSSPLTNPLDEIRIEGLKSGGKIAIAGIKARTADAERFLKLVLESIKRNEKSLDRLSKSMVNYVKDIMK